MPAIARKQSQADFRVNAERPHRFVSSEHHAKSCIGFLGRMLRAVVTHQDRNAVVGLSHGGFNITSRSREVA